MIRKLIAAVAPAIFIFYCPGLNAQTAITQINANDVERVEKVLSADDMMGRASFSKGNENAGAFIADEFTKAKLRPFNGDSYFQKFSMQRTRFISAKGEMDGATVNPRNIVAFSSQKEIKIDNSTAGFEKIHLQATDTLYPAVFKLISSGKNYFVTVDTAHGRLFNSLKRFRRESMPFKGTIVLVLSNTDPASYSIEFSQEITPLSLRNIVGVIPGRSRKNEYVIFSGHYDHLGTTEPDKNQDSIYNGANDDASGVTAVIELAKYFSQKKDNERTLVFAAFTAEEIGGYGSQYFSKQLDPSAVMAMFNIEMIGTESKWGKNSAYITGYEQTDMGTILEKNLEGTGFEFHPDPYPDQHLFYRSDNATLARLGVPAHTISTSKMDSEPYYHTLDDEIGTLDLNNMTEIIKAIALSSQTIVSGKDTPSRVDATKLR